MVGPWTTLVDPEALVAVLGKPGLVVWDCRHDLSDPNAGPSAYAAGHLVGAVHAHIDLDLSGPITPDGQSGRHPLPDPATFIEFCRASGIAPDTQVVAYDDAGGAWAARAWWLLRYYGHANVAVLDGGLQAAVQAGATPTTEVPAPEPVDFLGAPGTMPTVGTDSIRKRVPVANGSLLDARAAERFRGDVEPIDKRAGHIPGATNAPFSAHLGDDGRFLQPNVLAKRLQPLIGDRSGEEVAVYCGSGVTAAHLVLAMEVAGLGTPALYPASWSGWSADPARPAEMGP